MRRRRRPVSRRISVGVGFILAMKAGRPYPRVTGAALPAVGTRPDPRPGRRSVWRSMKPASRATRAGFRWAVCAPGHLLVTPRQGKVRVQSVPGVVGIAAHDSLTVDHGARATAWVDGPAVRGSPLPLRGEPW